LCYVAAMISAGRWIVHLRAHLVIARQGSDVEGIHQIRVASRRLDTWLVLGNLRVLRDDLRWLRASVSAARDLDVLAASDVPVEVAAWLRQRRGAEQNAVVAATGSRRTAALADALALLPDLDAKTARRSIARILRQVLRRGARLDPDAIVDTHLHALRRSVRRLRFAIEWTGDRCSRLAELQETFGEFNNNALLVRWLDSFPEPALVSELRTRLDAALRRQRMAVVGTWNATKSEMEALCRTWN